jgi:hypothetical protein
VWAQSATNSASTLKNGTSFIGETDLPHELFAALQLLGGRLTSAGQSNLTIGGTVTDSSGSRPAQIVLQAPGYLRYQENDGNNRVLTFDGTQFQAKNSRSAVDDERIEESFFSHFPDMLFLQMAGGGAVRRVGRNFRTDDGKTPNYTGPFLTIYQYTPGSRPGLTAGKALQQSFFVSFDQSTALPSEVRVVSGSGAAKSVTVTRLSNWFQQAGQWFPGQVVRLENGTQVLKGDFQQGAVSSPAPPAVFVP